ncbi:MAG TPA: tetratricopeptide repeat protein [Pyrinomonadaceae bacterium]|nr:tetratricopeptide repeat protein [Pyrinomonadaceae bacterium]
MLKSRLPLLSLSLILFAAHLSAANVLAQGGQTLFGDVRVTGDNNNVVPKEVMLILRRVPEGEIGRQTVSSRGRYRFTNLKVGEYEIVVEVNGKEIGRVQQIFVRDHLSNSPYGHQYDLDFRWRADEAASPPSGGVISAADVYERPAANRSLFQRAEESVGKKNYDSAIDLLKQIVARDQADFQAWTALGTVYFAKEKLGDAETAYLKAIEIHPTSPRAQLNLGRVRSSQKKFDAAVEPLTKAVELQPTSGDANYLLGECYLQLKKGSKAIPYLNEAANLGRPEAHLRLGWLYNAAGMKDKAALEFEAYLRKDPNYHDRDKLKAYIATNKKG